MDMLQGKRFNTKKGAISRDGNKDEEKKKAPLRGYSELLLEPFQFLG